MRDRGAGGRILNTISAFSGAHGYALYAAAKAAVASFTLTAAAEGAPYGIAVNAVSPVAITRQSSHFFRAGLIDRNDKELLAYLGPHNNAALAVFLVSDLAKDITGELFRIGPVEFKFGSPFRIGLTNIARTSEIVSPQWTPQGVADAISLLLPEPSVALKSV
jgi:NAD(P)-dependent dehydrogenase (short-subunit alcohol dehydrogenase family)